MKLQIGEVYMDKVSGQVIPYPNKTKKYLLPCLLEYGREFMDRLNNVHKIAAGIGDVIVSKILEKHVFILLNSKIAEKFFIEFLDWIRDQSMYEDDYVFDNIQKSTYHMIILKFPEKHYSAFETFKKGEYSKMYDKKHIEIFFKIHPDVKKILIKDHNYKIVFVNKLNKFLGNYKIQDKILPKDWDGELDFPPDDVTELFNHHLKKK